MRKLNPVTNPVTRMKYHLHLPVDCPPEKAAPPRDSGAAVGPRVYPVSWSVLEDLTQVCKLSNFN